MIKKGPRNREASGDIGSQRLHAESLACIMSRVENVDAEFLGQGVCPMRSFTSDKGVHSLFSRQPKFTSGAASDHTDLPANLRAARQNGDFPPNDLAQTFR